MNSNTQIEIYPKMKELKARLPSYKYENGFTWEEYAYIGQLETRNRIKFGRINELHELVKDMKEDN